MGAYSTAINVSLVGHNPQGIVSLGYIALGQPASRLVQAIIRNVGLTLSSMVLGTRALWLERQVRIGQIETIG